MELAGHECVGFCEFDKFATASYVSMHCATEQQREYLATLNLKDRQNEILKEEYRNGEWYADDVRRVNPDDIPDAECWCFGFPCQDISISGHQRGFTGNRSSLFYRIMYLVGQLPEKRKPDVLFIENVKNLLSVNRGWDFARLLVEMDRGGYDAEWQVINSKHHGVPQNRERVFVVGHNRNSCTGRVFPIEGTTDGVLKTIQCDTSGKGHKSQSDRAHLIDGIMCCVPNTRAETFCVTFVNGNAHVLTARERLRLQGFDEYLIDRAYLINKPKALAAQAGNSVTVNVIKAIAERLGD